MSDKIIPQRKKKALAVWQEPLTVHVTLRGK